MLPDTGMESQQAALVTIANAPSASTQRKGQEVSDGGHFPPTSPWKSISALAVAVQGPTGLQCFKDVRRLNRTSEQMQMLSGYF